MGKILRPLSFIAAIAVNFIPGAGQALSGVLFGAAASAGATLALTVGITALGLASAATMGGRKGATLSPFDPKSINPDPTAPRKLVFGQTTFPVDMRYAEPSGTDQEYIDYIFALSAHKSDAISEIYIEDDLAWTSGGGAQGKYAGYLTVEVILEAGPSAFHTVNAGTKWGSSTRMTGCTTMKVRVKRSDNSKSSQSPFASGINGRWAVIGRGIPVYDPARDSTVAGGSGTQRANDQSTWAYTASGVTRGNNPALQLLTYLIGWRINGVLSVGCGLPVDALDLPSFGAAAALCDESIALNGGGTQRRFEAGRAFSDADDPLAVIKVLCDAMNAELVDDGGRLSLRIAVNDLTPSVTLTDDDFVSGYQWRPAPPIAQQYTVVRGRFSQPAHPTLYSLADYPEVTIPRTSLAPRPLTLELSAVQDQRRAQRIAKQAAQRNLYMGEFEVALGLRGWQLRRNMVVAITSSARGWNAKLFRVRSLSFNQDGTIDVVFREENAAIYAWDREESAQVTPVAPVVFDTRNAASWLMADIAPGADGTRGEVPALPRGEWASGVDYVKGDLVVYLTAVYAAKIDHTSATGNKPPSAAEWELIAPAGDASKLVSVPLTTVNGSATVTLGSFSVRAGNGGEVALSTALTVTNQATSNSNNGADLTWQRETSPGTWANVGATFSTGTLAPGASATGQNVARTETGLTAGNIYPFRLVCDRDGPAYDPLDPTAEVVRVSGSISGQGL